jgi:phosphopantothenoylcysteine decarboxylase/phosphopantothenate--cysteine ligase
MNSNMLAHPAVQQNLQALASRGVRFVDPGEGYLACGWIGKGRLAEPDQIVAAADAMLAPASRSLSGRKVLVTAGPTYEDIDPVRYVGNRSSGRMGFAIAAEAKRRGATVILVTGPTRLEPPAVDQVVKVRSAEEMHDAVMRAAPDSHAVVMAAAVADYTPAKPAGEKIAKSDGPMTLTLERTADILAKLGDMRSRRVDRTPVLVGFAAETSDAAGKGREKLARKKVDLIVANDVSRSDAGFDVETNAVTLVSADGAEELPLQSKAAVAGRILDRIERLIHTPAGAPARA